MNNLTLTDEALEALWAAAAEVLYHDVSEETPEYQFNKALLLEKFRLILLSYYGEE